MQDECLKGVGFVRWRSDKERLEAGLEGVGSCSLCHLSVRYISWKNLLGKALNEVERDFPLFSLACSDSFQHSLLKKGCSADTTVNLFLPYVFNLGFLFSLCSPPPAYTHSVSSCCVPLYSFLAPPASISDFFPLAFRLSNRYGFISFPQSHLSVML